MTLPIARKSGAYPGRIIFDHIPKTAGMAVNSWLQRVLGQGCVSPNSICEHWEAIGKYGGILSIISAHIFFHDGDALDPRYDYVTILREPIDREITLRATEWDKVVKTPALIWLEKYLGVADADRLKRGKSKSSS